MQELSSQIPERVAATAACRDLPAAIAGADAETVENVIRSLAEQLPVLGWRPMSDISGGRTFTKNGRALALDQIVPMVAAGQIRAENWTAACAYDQIDGLRVPIPAERAAIGTAPAGGYRDPFELSSDEVQIALGKPPGMLKRRRRQMWIALAIGGLITLVVGIQEVHKQERYQDHFAGHYSDASESEVPIDGSLTVDGGAIRASFTPREHEWEAVSVNTRDSDFPDAAAVSSDYMGEWSQYGRNGFGVNEYTMYADLNDPQALSKWLQDRGALEYGRAGRAVPPAQVKVDGHAAWLWTFDTPRGGWRYDLRIPDGKRSFSYTCRLQADLDSPEARQRCAAVAATLKLGSS